MDHRINEMRNLDLRNLYIFNSLEFSEAASDPRSQDLTQKYSINSLPTNSNSDKNSKSRYHF